MKHILTLAWLVVMAALCAPQADAQLIKERQPTDTRYLAGAVPVVDGVVTFTRSVTFPADTDLSTAYDGVKHWVGQYFSREENQVLSRKNIEIDSTRHFVKVGINQYLVFKSNALALDRAQFVFSLAIALEKGKAVVTVSDIVYYYGDDSEFTDKSNVEKYDAETWITDEACLNKKGTRLHKQTGKFRIKTIDKVDQIAASLAAHLNGDGAK